MSTKNASGEMKVSSQHGAKFYCKLAKKFLKGTGDRPPVDELIISATDTAISIAVVVASHAEAECWGRIKKIETSYPELPSTGWHSPHLRIVLQEYAGFREKLSKVLEHKDHVDQIACIFAGALKYGAEAQSEIFEELVFLELSEKQEAGLLSTRDRLKGTVSKLKKLTGQRRRYPLKMSADDSQVLLLRVKHWLEATDSKHRYGGLLHHYYDKWKESDTTQNFFYWLDDGEGKKLDLEKAPRDELEKNHVKYLTVIEREQYLVEVKDGKMQHGKTGEVLNGPKIFVMCTKGYLYMGTKERGRFHHSSFLGGAPVLVAGSAVLVNGEIAELNPHSGHYRPTPKDFKEFLVKLEQLGISDELKTWLDMEIQREGFGIKTALDRQLSQ